MEWSKLGFVAGYVDQEKRSGLVSIDGAWLLNSEVAGWWLRLLLGEVRVAVEEQREFWLGELSVTVVEPRELVLVPAQLLELELELEPDSVAVGFVPFLF